ncbi:MAG: hypothetical protein HRU75_14430 [Planctomycetia bacterium]|nr:MAG: hypothetical protein HRU75_14430 [Planctomycetia bacterium]
MSAGLKKSGGVHSRAADDAARARKRPQSGSARDPAAASLSRAEIGFVRIPSVRTFLSCACLLLSPFMIRAAADSADAKLIQSIQRELERAAAAASAAPAAPMVEAAGGQGGGTAGPGGASAAARAKQAAQGLEELAAEHGSSAELEQLASTAYYLAGDVGRAVLHLRRAQRFAPGDNEIRGGLELLRSRIEGAPRPADRSSWIPPWSDIHGRTSLRARWWLTVAGGVVGFGGVGLWLWLRRPALLVLAALGGAAWGGAGGSVLVQLHQERVAPPAIVIEPQLVRTGRGEWYDAMRAAPLPAGSEIVIQEVRAGWVRLSLPAGETGWIPEHAVERVVP